RANSPGRFARQQRSTHEVKKKTLLTTRRSEPRLGPTADIAVAVIVGGRGAVHLRVSCLGVDRFTSWLDGCCGRSARGSPEGAAEQATMSGGIYEPARGVRAAMQRRGEARGPSAAHISAVPPDMVACAAAPETIA